MTLWGRLSGRTSERRNLLGDAMPGLGEASEPEAISEADRRQIERNEERAAVEEERERRQRDAARRSAREIADEIRRNGVWMPPSARE